LALKTPARKTPKTTERKAPGVRVLAAQATRDSILSSAIKIFSRYGFDGGSVEKISKAAKSYDRMIYYYFGSKEGLIIATVEAVYGQFNEAESSLKLPADPLEALKAVVVFMLRYYRDHPEFVAILNSENIHRGKHISKSMHARDYSSPAVQVLNGVLERGAEAGVMRSGVKARDLYLMLAALGYFYQSNRFTLSAFLGEKIDADEAFEHWEAYVIDSALRVVRPD
jgi:AcrR family transcriptional regulator